MSTVFYMASKYLSNRDFSFIGVNLLKNNYFIKKEMIFISFSINIITNFLCKIKMRIYDGQLDLITKGRGIFRECKKRVTRRRNCVGITRTKQIFDFTASVSVKSFWNQCISVETHAFCKNTCENGWKQCDFSRNRVQHGRIQPFLLDFHRKHREINDFREISTKHLTLYVYIHMIKCMEIWWFCRFSYIFVI